MVRVLVADDSATSRALLCQLIGEAPGLEVVGEAEDGAQAVLLTGALTPDVVTMDVRMPGLDGFEATRRIMAEHPTPVIIVSNLDLADVEAAMAILRVGALAAVPKPGAPTDPRFEARTKELIETITAMATVKVVRRRLPKPELEPNKGARHELDVVAIGASTGGPAALHTILSALDDDFDAAILVVQHIADGFVQGFADWLDRACGLEVRVAEHGAPLSPRTVRIAPTGCHLGVRNGRVHLLEAPPVGGFRPSATVLFDEVAAAYGRRAAGLILSGMGRDGVDGLTALSRAGGLVVAQSAATCAVFGMPGAAVEAGVVAEILDPLDMAHWLSDCRGERR